MHRSLAGERPSRFLDCGRNPIGATVPIRTCSIPASLAVEAHGTESSSVYLTLQATATAPAGGTRSTCRTTGRLEARLVETISSLLLLK